MSTCRPLALLAALCAPLLGCPPSNLLGDDQNDGSATAPDQRPLIYDDLPAAPILDQTLGALPANIADQFGTVESGAQSGGPCVLEPEPGSLFPANWLRLRVRLRAAAGQNVFEIRLRAKNQQNELRIYTRDPAYTLPAAVWTGLSGHSQDEPIHVTVRGAQLTGDTLAGPPALGLSTDITIAPVRAAGTIVYWTTSSGTALKGFAVGEETVRKVYGSADVGSKCVGCHSSTPDGASIAFSATQDPGNGDPAVIDLRSADGKGSRPSYLSAAAATLLGRTYQQAASFSRAHFSAGDRTMISMLQTGGAGSGRYEIIWTDLEAQSADQDKGWGVLRRTGDSASAGAATFSHDGQRVLYVSASNIGSGVTSTDGDLRIMPYANRQGGASTKVQGASEAAWNEYYPTLSPDDILVAFNRVPQGMTSYNNAAAEVFVVPTDGGTALRLPANDPPACGGAKSPGVTNSWPKWSPETAVAGARRYYWLIFSSTRNGGGQPQLFLAPLVNDGGTLRGYPALYLWNQPANEANHTPAWDVFKLIVG